MMKFKKHIDVILIIFILVVMYFDPTLLSNFSRTILGKIVFLALIVCTSMHNKITGLILVLLLVSMSQNVVEGLENSDSDSSSDSESKIQKIKDIIGCPPPTPCPSPTAPPGPTPPSHTSNRLTPPSPPPSSTESFISYSNELLTMQSLLAPRASNSLIFH